MENIFDHLLESGLELIVEKSTSQLLQLDETYQNDLKDLKRLEMLVDNLKLDTQANYILQDYLACYNTVQERIQELSYLAAVRDTVQFFHKTGLFPA